MASSRSPRTTKVHPPSPRLRGDEAGVSEVVGALMLVLVVLSAATSFGLFIQDQQEKVQRQKATAGLRALESIEVLAVAPELNATAGDRWLTLNFTVASLHGEATRLRDVRLNGAALESYTLWRQNRTSGGLDREDVAAPDAPRLLAHERVFLLVEVDAAAFVPQVVYTVDAVAVELATERNNLFGRTFLPPEALAVVDVQSHWNGTAYVDTPVLDGSLSGHPDPRGRIVRWSWSVDGGASFLGRRVLAPFACDGATHDVELVVADASGLLATSLLTNVSC